MKPYEICDFCDGEIEAFFIGIDGFDNYDKVFFTTRYCADHYKEWKDIERLALYVKHRGQFELLEGRDCRLPNDGRTNRHGCFKW